MIEYLLVPAAGLLLALGFAVQFLLHGVTYGPRARRALLLLGIPVVAAGLLVGLLSGIRPLWGRVTLGAAVAAIGYLVAATGAVVRWRVRKLAALAGDLSALRQRLAARRREVEALFWEMAAHPERPTAPRAPDKGPLPQGSGALEAWRVADPEAVAERSAQIEGWRAEFARSTRAELVARARVLEAASTDVPEDGRETLEARLHTLWLVCATLPETAPEESVTPRSRWDAARREVARLQAELADVLRQQGVLRRQRLPLD